MDLARQFGLSPQVIEKDYVLGWLLAGISAHPLLQSTWVFKGGTCLKKCYFETYRFSEDLDFTIINIAHLDQAFLLNAFTEITHWIYEQSGIEMSSDTLRFDLYENARGKLSVVGKVGYRGPMQRRGDVPRIKLDLTGDEILVLEPKTREVNHPYSDIPPKGIQISCYAFEEVFAEKIRALAERTRPRDLYDVINLFRHDELRPDQVTVVETLKQKCKFKGIAPPAMTSLEAEPARTEIEIDWVHMLAHQLPALPSFRQFWQELPDLFDWLYGGLKKVVRPSIVLGRTLDDTWYPPAMMQAWNTSAPLEIIRFAAANRLCVQLEYQGSTRLIEPYSLRKSKDGNLLLFAVRHRSGENRSYRVDRIQRADVTETSFSPRYAVELTAAGPISAPAIQRSPQIQKVRSSRSSRKPRAFPARRVGNYGPKYIYQCSFCSRQFTRKKQNPRMRPHKDQSGYPCSGRVGYLVDTKY